MQCIGLIQQKRIIKANIGEFQPGADCTFIFIKYE